MYDYVCIMYCVCVCVRARACGCVCVCFSLTLALSLHNEGKSGQVEKDLYITHPSGIVHLQQHHPTVCHRHASPTLNHPEVCVCAYPGR